MLNPAEEIVNIWLQDHHNYFTISNLVIPKQTRIIKGKKIGGGRGKEIDFLATDGDGKYYWIEVSVSPNPRLPGGPEKSRKILVDNAVKKFEKEKEEGLHKRFKKISKVEKWFVYSPRLFTSLRNGLAEEELYCSKLREKNIKAVSFSQVLEDIYEELDHFGYDFPRQYIFLLKKMGYKRER